MTSGDATGAGGGDITGRNEAEPTVIHRRLDAAMQERHELSVPADCGDGYATLLDELAAFVRARRPGSVTLSGIHWNEGEDTFVVDVFMEDPQFGAAPVDGKAPAP